MNAEQAKAIFDAIPGDKYMCWCGPGYVPPYEMVLDGKFTADELEAIAWWMRNAGEGKP